MTRSWLNVTAALLSLAAVASTAGAQVIELPPGATVSGATIGTPSAAASAATVQLPTFNFFTISTTVLVPDRGGLYAGGAASAASGLRANGGMGQAPRAITAATSAGGISIHAEVHDFAALEPTSRTTAAVDPAIAAKQVWQDRIERAKQSSAGRPTCSVAEARRMRDAGRSTP